MRSVDWEILEQKTMEVKSFIVLFVKVYQKKAITTLLTVSSDHSYLYDHNFSVTENPNLINVYYEMTERK